MPRFFSQWRRVVTPIALALVSLVAAMVLWIIVTDAQNPTREGVFSGGIEVKPVNLPDGLAVASIRDPTVSLKISADEGTFRKLTIADFTAEIDLSGERAPTSDKIVLARVLSRKDVQIIEVSPTFVTVTLEPLATKQVQVQANLIGSPPQGYSVSGVESTPSLVRISGAASLVQLVGSAYADVNLTGLRASLVQRGTLIPRDPRGIDIRGVSIEPANVDLKINVAQQEVTLALTVVPQVQGTVADGYNLVGIASDPPAIAVQGPLELLQAVGSITTEPVDVSGLRADQTRTVRLRLPSGLQSPRDNVTVRLRVLPALGESLVTVAPQVTGLGEGLRASIQTATIAVRVRGELPALRALQPGAVRATVSCSGLDEGVHVLTATLATPEGITVTAIDPQQVVVALRR